MSSIEIPQDDKNALIKYFKLEAKTKKSIIQILQSFNTRDDLNIIVEKLINEVKLNKAFALKFINTFTSLIITREKVGMSNIGYLTTDIIEELKGKKENFDEDIANNDLMNLLSLNSLILNEIKGEQLAINRRKLITETQLISDIRPIFTESDFDNITSSVLLFTLKLSYRENNEDITDYFALDISDLELLKEQIVRAEKKAKIIETKLNNSGIKIIKF